MKPLHAKSSCCGSRVYRYGHRRRRCEMCGKTWRIRQKKIGRKAKRVSSGYFKKYLKHEIPSLYAQARVHKQTTDDQLRLRLKQSLQKFLFTSHWPRPPRKGPLVLLADAMVCRVERRWVTFYFMLIRKQQETKAIILKPSIYWGTETWFGWQRTLEKCIPHTTETGIVAIVCDGHNGLVNMAKTHDWFIQRCQFHLIARLQLKRSKWHLARHGHEGKYLYELVKQVMTSSEEDEICVCLNKLREISRTTIQKDLKGIISGFTKHYQDYRTYLTHPELHLPRTNNATESLIGSIQALRQRARGFRTLESLTKWIYGFLKEKQKATCNGYFQPN